MVATPRLNPFSPAWRRIMAARSNVADHNTIGEGTILGGLLLVKAGDGGIAYMHAGAVSFTHTLHPLML